MIHSNPFRNYFFSSSFAQSDKTKKKKKKNRKKRLEIRDRERETDGAGDKRAADFSL
jgi:hypothetical protein